MAELCRNCYADCTEDIAAMPLKKKYRCKCGSDTFLYQADDPKVPYIVTTNDRRLLLRRLAIAGE